jgi:hypothetical protein
MNKLNPSINYNRLSPLSKYQDKFNKYDTANLPFDNDVPFDMTQNNDHANYYCGGDSSYALRGIGMNNTKVSKLFFSEDNIARVQKFIKMGVLQLSGGKYKLDEDQDEQDLLIVMRAVFLEHGKNLDSGIVEQVKYLNKRTMIEIMPGIMTNLKQYYGYLKDISTPIQPMPSPLNVGHAGRKTLPSVTTVTMERNAFKPDFSSDFDPIEGSTYPMYPYNTKLTTVFDTCSST